MVTRPHRQAIKKGNMEGAKIYAAVRVEPAPPLWCVAHSRCCCVVPSQNAIREKNQALNYLRLSSRIDAVSVPPSPACGSLIEANASLPYAYAGRR